MNDRKVLRWGIMGAGNIGSRMAGSLTAVPNNKLIAVASKSAVKAKEFADRHNVKNFYNYHEIVNDPDIDIIYVATTHNFHFENAKLALEHGKHVLIEKAFTVNAREARVLASIARENKLFLMEAIWTRFLPSINLLKSKLLNGEIGTVKQINISYGKFVGPDYEKRLKDPALAGGVTLDMGIYPISMVCYLLGEIPINIKSMTRFSDLGVDEISNYMFRFPSGCLAIICTSYNLEMKNEAVFYGSKGFIEFPQFQKGERFVINIHDGTNDIKDTIEVFEKNHIDGFIYQIEEVYNCIMNGKLESDTIPLNETIGIMDLMDKMRAEWGFVYPFE